MPGVSQVAFILGVGPNIGRSVAQAFVSKGYNVALAARSLVEADSTDKLLNVKCDFSNPEEVVTAFEKVTKVFGIPSVVIYNASSAAFFTPPDDPFAISLPDFNRDTAINITSAFVAAKQAVLGFAQLPDSSSRTFIYTGNILNTTILPRMVSPGAGKSAAAHMMWGASIAYKDHGYKFYYADERKADGTAIYKVNGDAHAKIYWELAERKTQGPWMQTFVKGVGYTSFDNDIPRP